MKKQIQTRISQKPKKEIYNSLDARIYRICTRPTPLKDFEKGIDSSVVTPLGEIIPVKIKFSEREIHMSFKHNNNTVNETCTLPSDDAGIFYGSSKSPCGKFLWCVRKYNALGDPQLIIQKKYYTDYKTVKKKNKTKKKRKIQDINQALIGITQKRVSKKPKSFIPNFKKPSASSYY